MENAGEHIARQVRKVIHECVTPSVAVNSDDIGEIKFNANTYYYASGGGAMKKGTHIEIYASKNIFSSILVLVHDEIRFDYSYNNS